MKTDIVIDATETSLGRIASHAAKQALLGKTISIVNCDKAHITGNRRMIIDDYTELVRKGGASLRGPYPPKKSPERMVKRAIRGMLSYRQGRGEAAFARVKCYNLVPKELESANMISLKRPTTSKTLSLRDLAKEFN